MTVWWSGHLNIAALQCDVAAATVALIAAGCPGNAGDI